MNLPDLARPVGLDAADSEIERIRSEYDRRRREIPSSFYGWQHEANCFAHTQLVRACIAELTQAKMFPLENRSVADVGCGSGTWLLEFAQWEAGDLHGIDLDPSRIERARERFPSARVHVGDARQLPWPGDSLDLVSQFTLFSSILNQAVKRQIAAEMLRVAKPGGLILWFDLRVDNPNNANVRGIKAREIRSLFPDCDIRLRRVTLAPPLARRVVPVSWVAACLLEHIPFLRTHYLGMIRKRPRPCE